MQVRHELTLHLDRETLRKAEMLAAKQGMSLSSFVAACITASVKADDDADYEAARRGALELLDQGFHLGGGGVNRDELHKRRDGRR